MDSHGFPPPSRAEWSDPFNNNPPPPGNLETAGAIPPPPPPLPSQNTTPKRIAPSFRCHKVQPTMRSRRDNKPRSDSGCVSSRESFDAVVALPPKSRQAERGRFQSRDHRAVKTVAIRFIDVMHYRVVCCWGSELGSWAAG